MKEAIEGIVLVLAFTVLFALFWLATPAQGSGEYDRAVEQFARFEQQQQAAQAQTPHHPNN